MRYLSKRAIAENGPFEGGPFEGVDIWGSGPFERHNTQDGGIRKFWDPLRYIRSLKTTVMVDEGNDPNLRRKKRHIIHGKLLGE